MENPNPPCTDKHLFSQVKETIQQSLNPHWICVTNTPSTFECCAFTTCTREHATVVKSIYVNSNLEWKARIHTTDIPRWLLATTDKILNVNSVVDIITVFDGLQFCLGLSNPSYSSLDDSVYNTRREIVGRTELVSFVSGG